MIINKIKDPDDFQRTSRKAIDQAGIRVFGQIPFVEDLTGMSVRYLVDHLFARVVAGESGLDREVRNIFVGSMSVAAAHQHPVFTKPHRLIIASGDRSDMILAALDTNAACVVLTNNILPPANIIARAESAHMPLLEVPWDTYRAAQEIDRVDPLLTKNDTGKIDLLTRLVNEHVDIAGLMA